MDKPLTVEYAKEIGTAFIQTYYQSFDNGPRENLSALYVTNTLLIIFERNNQILYFIQGTRQRDLTDVFRRKFD